MVVDMPDMDDVIQVKDETLWTRISAVLRAIHELNVVDGTY